jgi:hypothetical protein
MGDGAVPEVFAVIAELKSIPIPQAERPRIDVSTHDNAGFTREYVLNMSDLPALTFEINWLPKNATHDHLTGLNHLQITGQEANFKVRLNAAVGTGTNSVVISFRATVPQFSPSAPVDNVYTASVQLQPTAAPTYGSS